MVSLGRSILLGRTWECANYLPAACTRQPLGAPENLNAIENPVPWCYVLYHLRDIGLNDTINQDLLGIFMNTTPQEDLFTSP